MKSDPTVVIVNPASAGGRTLARWRGMRDQLQRTGIHADEIETTGPGDATVRTRAALSEGLRRIVVVGGDGTLNEVVNGCFDEATGTPLDVGVTLCLIPSGSGGDFRRSAGIADADAGIDLLLHGRPSRVDVGRIDHTVEGTPRHHFFINVADWGVGATVVSKVNRSPHKGGGARGSAIFLGISLREVLAYPPRHVRVEVDGRVIERDDVTNVVIANGQYFGGGMRIAPQARISDGQLDVIIVPRLPRFRTILSIPRIYRGTHLQLPGVDHLRGRHVTVTPLGEDEVEFEAEGEPIGAGTGDISCVRGAVRMLLPTPR